MPTLTYGTLNVEADQEGYLVRSSDWTPDLANAVARELGIELTPEHWKVLEFARVDQAATGQTPGLRRTTAKTGVSTKDIYRLFPKGPIKLIARIAGVPKPKSCL
jgi:TusE/DsrC/DsvC family sulfur relay protein